MVSDLRANPEFKDLPLLVEEVVESYSEVKKEAIVEEVKGSEPLIEKEMIGENMIMEINELTNEVNDANVQLKETKLFILDKDGRG